MRQCIQAWQFIRALVRRGIQSLARQFIRALAQQCIQASMLGVKKRCGIQTLRDGHWAGSPNFPFRCFDCQGRTFCILYFQMRELILLAFSLYCLVVTLFFALTLLWNCFYCLNACNCLWVGHYFLFFIAQKLFLLHLPNYCFAFVLPEWGK